MPQCVVFEGMCREGKRCTQGREVFFEKKIGARLAGAFRELPGRASSGGLSGSMQFSHQRISMVSLGVWGREGGKLYKGMDAVLPCVGFGQHKRPYIMCAIYLFGWSAMIWEICSSDVFRYLAIVFAGTPSLCISSITSTLSSSFAFFIISFASISIV